MSLCWRAGCEGIFLSVLGRSSDPVGRREEAGLSAPRRTRVGDFVTGSGGALTRSRTFCRRLSSLRTVFDIDWYSDVLEAKETLEEEEPGSVGEPSEFGSAERYLRDGTGGSSCDGGDVSGGVIIDRENEGWRESEGRSTSFFKQGRAPVVSVMPLGRACGRGPSAVLLEDRP